jgi:uncharacterized delta-60 repeat protein
MRAVVVVAIAATIAVVQVRAESSPTSADPVASAAAAPKPTRRWGLDPSFGVHGFASISDDGGSHVMAMAAQSDGKVLLAAAGTQGVQVIRFSVDGAPDPGFGVGGVAQLGAGWPWDLAVLPDGRLLVAGGWEGCRGSMMRLLPNGTPDTTFGGTGGLVTLAGAPDPCAPVYDLEVAPNGSTVAAIPGAVVRLTSTGALDPSFGTAGVTAIGTPTSSTLKVRRQPNGGTLVLAPGEVLNHTSAVTRLSPGGAVDPTFAAGGIRTISEFESARDLAVAPDNSFYVTGYNFGSGSPDSPAKLIHVLASGSTDPAFGGSGTVSLPARRYDGSLDPLNGSEGWALALDPDGSLVVGGQAGPDMALWRVSATGTADLSFGDQGQIRRTDRSWIVRSAQALARTPSGDYIVMPSSASQPSVARFTLNQPSFHPVSPVRVLDTRNLYNQGFNQKIGAGATPWPVYLAEIAGIPSNVASPPARYAVSAVALNVTVTEATAPSYLRLAPKDQPPATTSNVNFGPGQNVANHVIVGLGTDGAIGVTNSAGAVHVVIDLVGWYDAYGEYRGGQYHPLQPARILDSRNGTGGQSTPWGPDQARNVKVTGVGGVPASGVSSVVLNLTATQPTAGSYATIWPAGEPRPLASTSNFPWGSTVPNLVVAKVGAGGYASLYNNSGSVHFIADVMGWFDDGTGAGGGVGLANVPAARVLDSRNGTGGHSTPWGPNTGRDVQVAGLNGVPADADAVVLNVIAVGGTDGSYLTVWPSAASMPLASNLNFEPGQTIANMVVAKVGAGGKVAIYNAGGSVNVVADVVAYFR